MTHPPAASDAAALGVHGRSGRSVPFKVTRRNRVYVAHAH